MTMRCHWGLGIGHVYSHGRDMPSQQHPSPPPIENPEDIDDGPIPPANNPEDIEDGPPLINNPEDVEDGPPESGRSTPSEPQDSDPEDQDVDSDDEASADTSEGFDGDDDDYLEIHDTYNSD